MDCSSVPETAAEFRKPSSRPAASPVGRVPRKQSIGWGEKNQKGEIRAYALSVNARSSLGSIYNCTSTTNILIPHHIVFSRTRGYLTQIRRRWSKDVRRRHTRPRHPPSDEDPEHPHPPPSKSEHPPRARGPDPSRRWEKVRVSEVLMGYFVRRHAQSRNPSGISCQPLIKKEKKPARIVRLTSGPVGNPCRDLSPW